MTTPVDGCKLVIVASSPVSEVLLTNFVPFHRRVSPVAILAAKMSEIKPPVVLIVCHVAVVDEVGI